jgi:hypothetical protein
MQLSANAANRPRINGLAAASLGCGLPEMRCQGSGHLNKCTGHKKTHRVAAAGFEES